MKFSCLLLSLIISIFRLRCQREDCLRTRVAMKPYKGVLYTPAGKGPFPALVVIHEWWGLNDWVKEQASKLSDEGYVTLAVDLYRGKVATTPDEAHEIMRGVPEDRAGRDLHAAFEFLKAQPECEERSYRLDRLVHGRRLLARRGIAGAQPWPPPSSTTATWPPTRIPSARLTLRYWASLAGRIAAFRWTT